MKTINNKILLFALFGTLLCTLIPQETMAQGGIVGTLTKLKTTISQIVNVVFIIALIIGLIVCIFGFITDHQHKWNRLLWLIAAIALWFGFQTIVDQLSTDIGGTGGFK